MPRPATNQERDEAIRAEYEDGKSVDDLAFTYQLSKVRIYQICEGATRRRKQPAPLESPVPGGSVLSVEWAKLLHLAGKKREEIPGAFDAWIEGGQLHVHVRLPMELKFEAAYPAVRLNGREVLDVVGLLHDPADPTLFELVFDLLDPWVTHRTLDLAGLGRRFLQVAYRSSKLQIDQVNPAESLAFPSERGFFGLMVDHLHVGIGVGQSGETPDVVLSALHSALHALEDPSHEETPAIDR